MNHNPTTIEERNVTIKKHCDIDIDGEYQAFVSIDAQILVHEKEAGCIHGTIIHRDRIPEGHFLSVMDGHSDELSDIGRILFHARNGRSKLNSIQAYDDHDVDDKRYSWMFLSEWNIRSEYEENGASDVGTFALRTLLKDLFGEYSITLCVYELKNDRQRIDANQFLRNGFFQDDVLAKQGYPQLLVATYGHWTTPLRSQNEADEILFYYPPTKPSPPSGIDAKILKLTMSTCASEVTSSSEVSEYETKLFHLINSGGSLDKSHAIHAAIYNNNIAIMKCIIDIDSSTLESRDAGNYTPLMAAAINAARNIKAPRDCLRTDQPIIDMLLAAGVKKDALSSVGKTAYGTLKAAVLERKDGLHAMMGLEAWNGYVVGLDALEEKLMPPNGPSTADLNGLITI